MTKKMRRQLKKTTNAWRKALKRTGGPLGLAAGALTLGGLAAVAVLAPGARHRPRSAPPAP